MMSGHRLYRISQLERLTRIPKRTIQFYVDTGLLHPPVKTGKTMAYYDDAHYQKLMFIKSVKKKGQPLIAIRQMITTREAEGGSFGLRLQESFVMDEKERTRLRQPRKSTGKATRERILREGSRMFREKGYKNTRVSDITSYLNIGKGSFYSYFSNKEELFLECVPLIFEEFFSKGWEKIRQEKDPFLRLILRTEIAMPVLKEFTTILHLSREAMKEKDPNLKKLGENIYRSVCRPIEADIKKGITEGIFRNVDAKLYCAFLLGVMESADNLVAMNPELSFDSLKNGVIDILSNSLKKEPR